MTANIALIAVSSSLIILQFSVFLKIPNFFLLLQIAFALLSRNEVQVSVDGGGFFADTESTLRNRVAPAGIAVILGS
ncbi:hypothetical protein Y032_0031g2325 [Ancylostoma ceylanicum]|uniref:Uncharacterized protein n=1 Tax=Ancylostoma ceylanicum TaxID=53326 RepID=A0A016UQS9_9BILA|nr:hypothetical protein Y032_0031g2325 [Ancylostoma ceylanicum]